MNTKRSAHGSFQIYTNNWRKNNSWFKSSQSAEGRGTWNCNCWKKKPPQRSSTAPDCPSPAQHQQAFISLPHRELTSNFCFSLWWLRVSGLRLRARLLSSRRRKLSKRCTAESWRGKTSFLSCGGGEHKSCNHLKHFILIIIVIKILCIFFRTPNLSTVISYHFNNGSWQFLVFQITLHHWLWNHVALLSTAHLL